MPESFRYFAFSNPEPARYFRVVADDTGAASGPVSRYDDGQWQPTVYPSLRHFLGSQLSEPREIAPDQLPGRQLEDAGPGERGDRA